MAQLQYDDVAVVDSKTKYVDVKRTLFVGQSSRPVPLTRRPERENRLSIVWRLTDELVEQLENYLNAQPPGRVQCVPQRTKPPEEPTVCPYLDYRPDVGTSLFPSPRTGMGISMWTIMRIRSQQCLTPKANKRCKKDDVAE